MPENPYASPLHPVPAESSASPPTHVRWKILVLLMATAGLCHFNRVSISAAGSEHIISEFSLEATQMGLVYSSYLFVYTLCMIPGGWLIDRFGPKKALLFVGLGSAILVPLTAVSSFASAASILLVLCVIRAMLGTISAPIHPGAARSVSLWFPSPERGMANGLVTGAAVAGVALTYFVFGFLMDLVGWPQAFVVAGVVTLLLTLVWAFYATDRPSEHRGVNASELALIETTDFKLPVKEPPPMAPTERNRDPSDFLSLLLNPSLIFLTLSYAMLSYFQYLFFYWVQYYFDTVLKFSTEEARLYATIPTLAMAVGMICGGWLLDRSQSLLGGWWGRAAVPICGMAASAIFLLLGIAGGPTAWVVACFALAMGSLGASEAPFWVTGVELGRQRGGLSGAILNAGGNMGGIPAPFLTPLFSHYFGWKAGLALASVLCLIGAVLWCGVRIPGDVTKK